MIISRFFTFLLLIKLFHWNTKSFAKHKAADECFITLLEQLDKFIEVYMGKYGRDIIMQEQNVNIKLQVLSQQKMKKELIIFAVYLNSINIADTELINIRDEMLAIIQKTLYLFTLT